VSICSDQDFLHRTGSLKPPLESAEAQKKENEEEAEGSKKKKRQCVVRCLYDVKYMVLE
jgi:hypothetical protein